MTSRGQPSRRTALHLSIIELLTDRPLTPVDLAAMLGMEQYGIESCLRGMERRGEVERVPYRLGTWAKWRIPKNRKRRA